MMFNLIKEEDCPYWVKCTRCGHTIGFTEDREDGFVECLNCGNEIDINECSVDYKPERK